MKSEIWNYRVWVNTIDDVKLSSLFDDILAKCKFEVLEFMDYVFYPHGYTALWLLAESHLAIHTFPENGNAYIELSSCNEAKQNKFIALVKEHFDSSIERELK